MKSVSQAEDCIYRPNLHEENAEMKVYSVF